MTLRSDHVSKASSRNHTVYSDDFQRVCKISLGDIFNNPRWPPQLYNITSFVITFKIFSRTINFALYPCFIMMNLLESILCTFVLFIKHKKIIDKSREFILKHSCNTDSDTMVINCCVKLFYVGLAASFWSHWNCCYALSTCRVFPAVCTLMWVFRFPTLTTFWTSPWLWRYWN